MEQSKPTQIVSVCQQEEPSEEAKADNSGKRSRMILKDLKNISEFLDSNDVSGDYRRVAIMGNQNTGKSFLLNELFGSNFKVMKSDEVVSQTTEGVWL